MASMGLSWDRVPEQLDVVNTKRGWPLRASTKSPMHGRRLARHARALATRYIDADASPIWILYGDAFGLRMWLLL